MNYGNRNATGSITVSDLTRGYVGALITSMAIALYTRKIFSSQLKQLKGTNYLFFNALLNYIAGALAGARNLILMRYKELKTGISVQDKDGKQDFGKSKICARKAIFLTALSRVVLPVPVLFFPAIGNYLLVALKLWPKNQKLAKSLEMILCLLSLTVALPMSIALFK